VIVRNCLYCGIEFTPRKRRVEVGGMGSYCSRSCHYAHKRSLPPRDWTGRFWSKVDKNGSSWNGTPCWIWIASIDKTGYGRFTIRRGSTVPAYQVSCVLAGKLIDKSQYQHDHLCRNRACVNPEHIEGVTQRVNLLRGESPPAKNARKDQCLNGHSLNEKNVYLWGPGRAWRGCRICRLQRQRQWRATHPQYQRDRRLAATRLAGVA
jgi:hypothetical protein